MFYNKQHFCIKNIFATFVLFSSTASCLAALQFEHEAPQGKYLPHIDLGGYYFTDTPHDAAFTGVFLPIAQDQENLLYADLRGIFKGNGGIAKEGNFGLSYRHLTAHEKSMFGGYIFLDRKKSTTGYFFSQVTLGAESWLGRWFAGANYYQPVGTHSVTQSTASTTGALTQVTPGVFNILLTQTNTSLTEVALVGGDVTIGYLLTDRFTGYAGGYYFLTSVHSVKVPTILGATLRGRYQIYNPNGSLLLGIFEQVALEGQLQYDHVRGSTFYAGARFSLGVGPAKLSTMQHHMVEQSLRDIDLVISGNRQSSTTVSKAKTESGRDIQVNQVTSTSAYNSAVGDATIDIIAVQGVLANANPSATALASGQGVTGGSYVIVVNGTPVTVQMSTGGELQSPSGSNLVKLGRNNTIRDITLTMVSPGNADTNNRAIYSDSTVDVMGNISISNVQSNGKVDISRTGAAQSGTVIITDSNFTAPSTWNPTSLPAIGQFTTASNATLNITLQNSTFASNSATQQVVGVRFKAQSNSNMTVESVQNCNINGSDGGLVNGLESGNITYNGGIIGCTIDSGSAVNPSEVGILNYKFGSNGILQIKGAISNNTITATSEGVSFSNFGGAGIGTFLFDGGFINNTVTTTDAICFSVGTNTGDVTTINGFYGNHFSSNLGVFNISLSRATTTVNVGQGSTGLSAANYNATVTTSNSPVVNPGL